MRIDLSKTGKLESSDSLFFDSLIPEINNTYNKVTRNFINKNGLFDYDLLLSVSNRNPASNLIYECISKLIFVKAKIANSSNINSINVDTYHEKVLLENYLEQIQLKSITVTSNQSWLSIKISLINTIILNLFKTVFLFLCSKFIAILILDRPRSKKNIIYVDSFLFPDSFSDDSFNDRYFTEYENFLDDELSKKIYFFPTLAGFRKPSHFFNIFTKSKKIPGNFIFQESILSITDYIYGLLLSMLVPLRKRKYYPTILDLKLDHLFKDSLKRDIFSMELNNALNKHSFIKKLFENDFSFEKVINWHENQNIDRALNLSFKKNFSTVQVLGYQGYFAASTEPHKIPLDFEKKLGTLPDKIGLISKHLLSTYKAKSKTIDYFLAPAFRFNWLYKEDDLPKTDNQGINKIVVALPIYESEVFHILDTCRELQKQNTSDLSITIKFHPSFDKDYINKTFKLAKFFDVSSENLSSLIKKSNLMISSSSSSCVESILMGVPVAVLGNNSGLSMSTIPDGMLENFWCIFYSMNDLNVFIERLNNQQRQNKFHVINKQDFIENVDKNNTQYLFG